MKAVYDIILSLRKESGKNAKLAILQKNESNADLQEFLRVCYEPRINFYQSKLPPPATVIGKIKFDRFLIWRLVDDLGGREYTGDAAKHWLGSVLYSLQEPWEKELLAMLIERDIKAGVSISSINKVWPNLVTEVPYMRCSLPKDSKLKQFAWQRGVFSQVKADGMFANITKDSYGAITIESRNGSPFPLDQFSDIVKFINKYIPSDVQLHGELLVEAPCAETGQLSTYSSILPRQEGNGILNKVLKGGEVPANHRIVYHAWDVIPFHEAVSGGSVETEYEERYNNLTHMIVWPKELNTSVRIIDTRRCTSQEEAKRHYIECLDNGLEGTVLKDPRAPWEDKTSKWQVKYKIEVAVDLRVKGFKPGRGKFEGMVGSLECETEDGLLNVFVGGFDDDTRKFLTENINTLIRKKHIISVKANGVMPPRKGIWSLFLPRFAEHRYDKSKADTLKQVQAQFEAAAESLL
jgi:DNA ligase 1